MLELNVVQAEISISWRASHIRQYQNQVLPNWGKVFETIGSCPWCRLAAETQSWMVNNIMLS